MERQCLSVNGDETGGHLAGWRSGASRCHSRTEEPEKKNTYIPDGSYEGFKWKDGQWVHVDKIFDFKLQDGQFPVDDKLRDDQGNIDEKKLEEASQKNIEKAEKKKPK